MANELIAVGGRVKALTGNRIGGQLIRFTGPNDRDLQGEYFDRKTNFYRLDGMRVVLFHHGRTKAFGRDEIGEGGLILTKDGIDIEADLNLEPPRLKAVMGKVEEAKLSWSSGSSSEHAAVSKTGRIEVWPIVEASISPFTVDPKATVVALKAFTDHEALKAAEIEIPAMRHAKLSVMVDALANTAERIKQFLGMATPAEPGAADFSEYGYISDLDWQLRNLEQQVRTVPAIKAGRVISEANRIRLKSILASIDDAKKQLNAFMDETEADPADALMIKASTDVDDEIRLQIALATYGA